MAQKSIVIVDFGSQYVQLIARRIREKGVHSTVLPPDVPFEKLKSADPQGIIFSGGPSSVYDRGAPSFDKRVLDLGVPILGICYGMQLLGMLAGGRIRKSGKREYGRTVVDFNTAGDLFKGLSRRSVTWMSHRDRVIKPPAGFRTIAGSADTKIAAFACEEKRIYGVQFHPEVIHTQEGDKILKNFLFRVCRSKRGWTMRSFIKDRIKDIRDEVGGRKVILGLSGGVDSSVAALLLHKAVGKKLRCILVDNGLLRGGERERVKELFAKNIKLDLTIVDAKKKFLGALKGITSPEKKRKIIGRIFIKVFEKAAKRMKGAEFLAQGTLYPDVIESMSFFGGPSRTIKSHHNVGGLPKKMGLKLIEPLRDLFKDEVREVGERLGLPREIVMRQPFPGPGLAVRIVGEVTEERLRILREADRIIVDIAKKRGIYYNTWQTFGVLLPVKSVGVMGDARTYENALVIRAVTSRDGMTADWTRIPHRILGEMSNAIINQVRRVNRVVFDISSKPPSTIEWE